MQDRQSAQLCQVNCPCIPAHLLGRPGIPVHKPKSKNRLHSPSNVILDKIPVTDAVGDSVRALGFLGRTPGSQTDAGKQSHS